MSEKSYEKSPSCLLNNILTDNKETCSVSSEYEEVSNNSYLSNSTESKNHLDDYKLLAFNKLLNTHDKIAEAFLIMISE